MKPEVDLDALLAALILAPRTFSRNRFFWLFEKPEAARIRRRAARVRGMLRQLTGTPHPVAEIVGERVLADGQVHLRYRVEGLGYTRTAALSALEAATLRYAMHRSGQASLSAEERRCVEEALARLNQTLGVGNELLSAAPPSSPSPAG
ncbi:MAG TPA: hypothetical protein VEQ59_17020 [Polyangiaceae bacterium]|nr:hypothetical protein [Polyangiaceae bacterium]